MRVRGLKESVLHSPYKIREHLTKPLKCEVPSPARQPTSVPSFRLFLHPDASSITGASLLATDPRGIREKSRRRAPVVGQETNPTT